ncbi:glycosyltransferase family 4 protein [Streptococcus thermophilus]|uniref:glycosyltransferase family 4 protein n=1 Tax=Streptococcus thermophilus TaxID=1308 RepID=UPI0015C24C40|nr:glycosyltransferase family 4 protein [Streptococcus thermophilus]MBZ5771223.1 glycosyltransferase family 4 protein [Streptococcus thermophilus]MBZ5813683.1 glycosyltransferase family 4 protein [Streptococcus thermophilus]MCT2912539.1 glycosyltransferase family 4 protein [Streptococcus thermophilus]MCT2916464.1 glycosyltransferase family 4 protein [Streptococcus thermophilus]CAD0163183.1 EpsS [Streptococcus thermophilus]
MRVCFISGVISRSGGTERVGTIIANHLANRGYDIRILSFWDRGKPYFQVFDNIKVDFLLDPKTEGKLYRTNIYPIVKLHNYLKRNQIDIVIDIDTALSYYTARAITNTKCKLVSWEHFNYWTMKLLNESKRYKAKELIKKKASALVVLTDDDRDEHIKQYDLPNSFVKTIHNPCMFENTSNYCFSNKTFLALGRLTQQKGFSMLLESWALVEKQLPDWNLIIAGSGELEESLLTQKNNLGLTQVSFPGHIKDVGRLYRNASAYVLSSVYEGFPMVILEAQSYALPVIAYDCKTGPKDLVLDNVNGFLVANGDTEKLAQAMIEFAHDEERANNMSIEALKSLDRFNIEIIIDQWEALFKEILAN